MKDITFDDEHRKILDEIKGRGRDQETYPDRVAYEILNMLDQRQRATVKSVVDNIMQNPGAGMDGNRREAWTDVTHRVVAALASPNPQQELEGLRRAIG